MNNTIKSVDRGSPAEKAGISAGDRLLTINGHKIHDVLDYKYYSYDARLSVDLLSGSGHKKRAVIRKPEGEDAGIEFESYLIDTARACANKCVFCFVDQLPRGMRSTLYFKDDDHRLSFLQGNYITLTNLSEREIRRIIDLRISPINVSVHSTEPELRSMLLGNKNGGRGIEIMREFAGAGITMNCQIVCCPGLNDGEHLLKSMSDLSEMYPGVASVSIVPVGLTKHRDGLYPLRPFDRALALETVQAVDSFGDRCVDRFGTRIFFCADELYLKAGLELPSDEYYEEYPQLENGVGMLRLFMTEFCAAMRDMPDEPDGKPFSAVSGCSAAPFMESMIEDAASRYPGIDGRVYAVENDFLGHTIDVAGLVTGGDIVNQLSGRPLGDRLLLPRNMLRHGETMFLDDMTVEELSGLLGVPIRIVEQDGFDFADAIFGN